MRCLMKPVGVFLHPMTTLHRELDLEPGPELHAQPFDMFDDFVEAIREPAFVETFPVTDTSPEAAGEPFRIDHEVFDTELGVGGRLTLQCFHRPIRR
jgi:hypothetical protein